jgi:8-oxo-dGTP pyrophosphatase MutT (NUDIX family)
VTSPYIRRVRAKLETDLLLLPSVTVLPRDSQCRILLVQSTDTGEWMTIGGMVEPDESPADAAKREALEEAGVVVELRGIVAALGGHEFRLTYSNGDQVAYVVTVFDAVVLEGEPHHDGLETGAIAWVAPHELGELDLSAFARAQFAQLGLL